MIEIGLDDFNDTKTFLIETLFPEKIEYESDEHECGCKQVDD